MYIDRVSYLSIATRLPGTIAGLVATLLATAPAEAGTNLISDGTFQKYTLTGTYINSSLETQGAYVCANNASATTCSSNLTAWSATCSTHTSTPCSGNYSPGSILLAGTNGNAFNPDYSGYGIYYTTGANGTGTSIFASPPPGNYVALDGDGNFQQSISQLVSGLVAGQQYVLTFYQAAAEEKTFNGNTTEYWGVSLGGGAVQYSPVQTNPAETAQPWTLVVMKFTATMATETLEFMSDGTGTGLPPVVLLADVSLEAPEPASAVLMLSGLAAIGYLARRRARA